MQAAQLKAIQTKIGTTPDAIWGPKSIVACQEYLRGLAPSTSPWPTVNPHDLHNFYGAPGDESRLTNLAVTGFGVKYDGRLVNTIRCHNRVAPSLLRIIRAISETPFSYVLANYAGCYNFRNMRGSSSPSIHAYGAAIDLDPDTNGNQQNWPVSCTMPLEVMEIFAREGWTPAGAFWGRDAMHFQATQIV